MATAGKVQTVIGEIDPDDLGVTHTHEHILMDISALFEEPDDPDLRKRFHQPLSMEILGWVRYKHGINLDNSRLDSVEMMIEETRIFKQAGGGTLVEATSMGLGRNPDGLARIARGSGINIVMGASYYVGAAHPANMDDKSEDQIVDEIVRDVSQGVGDTGVKSGIIGEVGCTWPLADNERKVLRASARAQRITGAPLLIHPGRHNDSPLEIIEILRDAGADISRTIMGHLDRTIEQQDTLKALADTGCYLEYDLFGVEDPFYFWNPLKDLMNDAQRLHLIAWLFDEGHGDQVLTSHDMSGKNRLVCYGGHGYAHTLENITPHMRRRGFQEATIEKLLVENPARILAFAEGVTS